MAVYKINNIIRDVKVCIDENAESEKLLLSKDIDTLTFSDIIKSKILEAVRIVHNSAPFYLLEHGHSFSNHEIYWKEKESGFILLPNDFMRLVSFKMSDWSKVVHTIITPEDKEYEWQRQPIKALRGTADRPAVAIVSREEGLALEFYSCKSESAHIENAIYIPLPAIDNHDGVDISEKCYNAVVYTIASLALATLSENEKANSLLEISKLLLQ